MKSSTTPKTYVRGIVHTNGIENFWALLKRGLGGTYISVEPFHLFRYIDEQAFRYEHRATKDKPYTNADRFAIALTQIAGKRLTWNDSDREGGGSLLGRLLGLCGDVLVSLMP